LLCSFHVFPSKASLGATFPRWLPSAQMAQTANVSFFGRLWSEELPSLSCGYWFDKFFTPVTRSPLAQLRDKSCKEGPVNWSWTPSTLTRYVLVKPGGPSETGPDRGFSIFHFLVSIVAENRDYISSCLLSQAVFLSYAGLVERCLCGSIPLNLMTSDQGCNSNLPIRIQLRFPFPRPYFLLPSRNYVRRFVADQHFPCPHRDVKT